MAKKNRIETRWLYTTSENISKLREVSLNTCIIPIGCIEKHGLHLPLGTDILQASHIVWRASQIETVCVFPDFTFGDIGECTPNTPTGTISLPVETQILLLRQLCEQIARNGFEKIILYNGHGGNRPWLGAFLQEHDKGNHAYSLHIINIHCDVMKRIAKAKAIRGLQDEDRELARKYCQECIHDGHAGYSETAYVMAVSPESVKMDRLGIISGQSRNMSKKYWDVGIQVRDEGWEMDYPDWIDSDDPVGCNERIGEAAMRLEAERVAGKIRKIKYEK